MNHFKQQQKFRKKIQTTSIEIQTKAKFKPLHVLWYTILIYILQCSYKFELGGGNVVSYLFGPCMFQFVFGLS